MKKILVMGFYSKSNLGDDLFQEAFKFLFPCYDFTFTDTLTKELVSQSDCVFFGGGSFLYSKPEMEDGVLDILLTKDVLYIGVGAETEIHPIHQQLLKAAKLVAVRSAQSLIKVKDLNKHTFYTPDIVFGLYPKLQLSDRVKNSVLVLNSSEVVPKWNADHWKHTSFNQFKSEFSQSLDILTERNFTIDFFSMCNNKNVNDKNASIELINSMKHSHLVLDQVNTFEEITKLFSRYSLIITQRYHGIILAEMTGTPYVNIYHHDKLKFATKGKNKIPYYGLIKDDFIDIFNSVNDAGAYGPINHSHFIKELQHKVNQICGG